MKDRDLYAAAPDLLNALEQAYRLLEYDLAHAYAGTERVSLSASEDDKKRVAIQALAAIKKAKRWQA